MTKSRQSENHELNLIGLEDSLFNRLRSCLLTQTKYKEAFRNLREALGGSQVLSSFPSMNSFHNNSDLNASQKDTNAKKSLSRHATKIFMVDNRAHGILMSDEDISITYKIILKLKHFNGFNFKSI